VQSVDELGFSLCLCGFFYCGLWFMEFKDTIKEILRDVDSFTDLCGQINLRKYQQEVAKAIVKSVLCEEGRSFVVIFPRQSGKNELQAQIECYLLLLYSQDDAEMVKVSPTLKPQSQNAMRRLERVLNRNILTAPSWAKESGYIYRQGTARILFLSGAPTASIVGATASTLLEVDEAQDVSIAKFDKDVLPMAASTNATRVYWGTAWTSKTLLAREKNAGLAAEKQDGIQRVWVLTAEQVGQEVPAYRKFVAEQVAKLGRSHPFVRTQYFSEEIDAEGGMFNTERRQLMQGAHLPEDKPQPGECYAFLLDVAGEDEAITEIVDDVSISLANPGRDATALTIVKIDPSSLESLKFPTYRLVRRRLWIGVKHTTIYGQLISLAETWSPRWIVCDATGIGAGLASFLARQLGEGRVIPFQFTARSKSQLGWDFLSVIETGRYKDYNAQDECSQTFWRQVENCQYEILPGPGKTMRWGVPDGARDLSGELIHDDLLISAALCALLDGREFGVAKSAVVPPPDPLSNLGW
jgi:hypothetical protein